MEAALPRAVPPSVEGQDQRGGGGGGGGDRQQKAKGEMKVMKKRREECSNKEAQGRMAVTRLDVRERAKMADGREGVGRNRNLDVKWIPHVK